MRIEENDDGSYDVFVRQSWIGDAIMCPERGRNGIVRPEWSTSNDLTILGTGVHAGIAADLEANMASGGELSMDDMVAVAEEAIEWEIANTKMRWVKLTRDDMSAFVPKLLDQYVRGLRPKVQGTVVAVEWGFNFLLDTFALPDGRIVRIIGKGTADLVTNGPVPVWDWKTSSQKYKQWEKQKTAHQPTMYAAAAVAAGFAEWPVRFNFGVMVRGGDSQTIPIYRDISHLHWLRSMVRPFVTTALAVGTEQHWPKNDTHFLCSDTWCPWFSVCKGSALAPHDLKPAPEMLS